MKPLTRRQVLLGAASLGVGAAGLGLHQGLVSVRRRDAIEALFQGVSWPGEMRELGRLYLELQPDEANATRLRSLVLPDLGPLAWKINASNAREVFSNQVQQDFDRGELVELEGWYFARSEARFAALFLLTEVASLASPTAR